MAVLAFVLALLGAGCKQASEWAEKRRANREVERQRAKEVHGAEPAPVRARPNGPGLPAGTYRLAEVRAEALPTDRKGKPWDDGSEPDLQVRVRADGKDLARCRASEDGFVGRCKLDVSVDVDARTQIEVVVFDADDGLDDYIGSAKLTDPSTWGLGIDLPLLPSHRLRAATIVLARRPAWWETYRYQLIGLASGITLALGLVAAFRSSLLKLPPAPRCRHCGIEIPAHLVNCAACGGIQTEPAS